MDWAGVAGVVGVAAWYTIGLTPADAVWCAAALEAAGGAAELDTVGV